jgi:hypothetical protein
MTPEDWIAFEEGKPNEQDEFEEWFDKKTASFGRCVTDGQKHLARAAWTEATRRAKEGK